MTEQPELLIVIQQWVQKAESDFKTAEHTLQMRPDECPYDTVCFHAQQTGEKYLKAMLVFYQTSFPKIHDIAELTEKLPSSSRPPIDLREQDLLSEYAAKSRYPGPFLLGSSEASQAMAIARRIREWARALLPKAALS